MKKYALVLVGWAVLAALAAPLPGQTIENVGPQRALELTAAPRTYLVDVRSAAEYVFVGHPPKAYNIPLSFWSESEQNLVPNDHFVQDLQVRFKNDDTLIFMCRSGGRSLRASQAAQAAGFKKVINVTDGFEGRKDDQGRFTIGGWKPAGLPYTYDVDPALAYKRVGEDAAPARGSRALASAVGSDPQARPGAPAAAAVDKWAESARIWTRGDARIFRRGEGAGIAQW